MKDLPSGLIKSCLLNPEDDIEYLRVPRSGNSNSSTLYFCLASKWRL